jgi:hypothetical protein
MYESHAGNAGMLLHVNGTFTMETFKPSLCCTVSLYTDPHCPFRGVDQGTKVFVYVYRNYNSVTTHPGLISWIVTRVTLWVPH